jgi:hypothetical protein
VFPSPRLCRDCPGGHGVRMLQGMVNKGTKATKTLTSSVPTTQWTLDFSDVLVGPCGVHPLPPYSITQLAST